MNLAKALKPIVGSAVLTAIAISVSAPVQAFQFSTGSNTATTVSGATTLDFDGLAGSAPNFSGSPINYTNGVATYTGKGRFVTGSITNRFAEPPNNDPAYLTLGAGQEPGPVTISFNKVLDYFGLYWGSIDTYNSIAFYRGNTLIKGYGNQAEFTAITTLLSPANGNQSITGARFVNFFADNSNEWFDKIVLSSTQAAFESDNHAYRAVPSPALIPSLIGVGVAALRKRKKQEAEEIELAKADA